MTYEHLDILHVCYAKLFEGIQRFLGNIIINQIDVSVPIFSLQHRNQCGSTCLRNVNKGHFLVVEMSHEILCTWSYAQVSRSPGLTRVSSEGRASMKYWAGFLGA